VPYVCAMLMYVGNKDHFCFDVKIVWVETFAACMSLPITFCDRFCTFHDMALGS